MRLFTRQNSNTIYTSFLQRLIVIYKKLDFVKLLKKSNDLFTYSFEQQDIKIKLSFDENLSIMANSKELVLFTIKLIETIISSDAKNFEILIIDKKLVLNIDQKEYNQTILDIFIKHYNSELLSELFENQIIKIEIKN